MHLDVGAPPPNVQLTPRDSTESWSNEEPIVFTDDPVVQTELSDAAFALQALEGEPRRRLSSFLYLIGQSLAGRTSVHSCKTLETLAEWLSWSQIAVRLKCMRVGQEQSSESREENLLSIKEEAPEEDPIAAWKYVTVDQPCAIDNTTCMSHGMS